MALKNNQQPSKVGISITEAAANTFTSQKIELPNVKGLNAFDLDKIEFRWSAPAPAAPDDYGSTHFQIQKSTGSSPTGMLGYDDDKVLYDVTIDTASGTEAADLKMIFYKEFGSEHVGYAEYIANDEVYLCVQGTANGAPASGQGKLIGSIEKLSQSELTTLLLNTLG